MWEDVKYAVSEKILRGANSHGRISLLCLFASLICLLLLYLADVSFTPYSAAASISAIMLICVHVPVILFTWGRLDIDPWQQINKMYSKPLLANVIYLIVLLQIPSQEKP